MAIVVEPYAPPDRDAVAALIVGIQQGELGVPITLDDQPDLQDVPGFYQRGAGGCCCPTMASWRPSCWRRAVGFRRPTTRSSRAGSTPASSRRCAPGSASTTAP